MGQVTTHTEGRVVTTNSDDDSVEVAQLPQRDAAAPNTAERRAGRAADTTAADKKAPRTTSTVKTPAKAPAAPKRAATPKPSRKK